MSFQMATLVMDGFDWLIIGVEINARYFFRQTVAEMNVHAFDLF